MTNHTCKSLWISINHSLSLVNVFSLFPLSKCEVFQFQPSSLGSCLDKTYVNSLNPCHLLNSDSENKDRGNRMLCYIVCSVRMKDLGVVFVFLLKVLLLFASTVNFQYDISQDLILVG